MYNKKSFLLHNSNNIKISKFKSFNKVGNSIFNLYNQRLQWKYKYLDIIKKKYRKLKYFKEIRRIKKNDKMRFKKLSREEPFPLFFSKDFKNVKHVFKQVKKKKLKESNILSYNKILYLYKIYEKLNKKYIYFNDKLKKLKDKKKYIFKLKFNLWNSLININYDTKINYLNSLLFNIDFEFKFLPFIQLNYWWQKNKSLKNKIFYSIFEINNSILLKNKYKVDTYDFTFHYNVYRRDLFFYIFYNLKKVLNNTFFNKYFLINFDSISNYLYSYYYIIQFKLLNNIALKLKLKNYNNFLVLIDNKIIKNYNFYNINKKKNIQKTKNFLNLLYNKVKVFTTRLMKEKIWTKHAIAKRNSLFIKKLVVNNTKLNMRANDKSKLYNKVNKFNYNSAYSYLKEDQKFVKIHKYDIYFNQFLKKFLVLRKNIIKKYHKYNYHLAKKYHYFISLMKFYFIQLFEYLKFIFNNNVTNIYNFFLKFKLLLIYIYYRSVISFIKPIITKKKKLLLNNNKLFTFNLILYYKKAIRLWWSKKKKEWNIKKKTIDDKKEIEHTNKYFQAFLLDKKYAQPVHTFQYNPALNPKHNLWASRKIQKRTRIFNVIKYKINSYLRWYKWETKRKLQIKKRIIWLKKRKIRKLRKKVRKAYKKKKFKVYIKLRKKLRKIVIRKLKKRFKKTLLRNIRLIKKKKFNFSKLLNFKFYKVKYKPLNSLKLLKKKNKRFLKKKRVFNYLYKNLIQKKKKLKKYKLKKNKKLKKKLKKNKSRFKKTKFINNNKRNIRNIYKRKIIYK